MRTLVLLAAFTALGASASFLACAEDAADPVVAADAGTDAPGARRDGAAPEEDAGEDAGARTTCQITRAYVEACGADLTCGPDDFDAWCEAADKAINSEAYRRAEAQCLTPDNCDGTKRRDCEYRSYGSAAQTDAQKALVAAFCQTCEPGNAGCAARVTTYDVVAGPAAVTDEFIAAWELGDALTDEIRTKCTGAALDAGADAGDAAACAKAFAGCAGDLYVDRLPDCP